MKTLSLQKYGRGLRAIQYALRHPSLLKKSFIHALQSLYRDGMLVEKILPELRIEELVNVNREIKLRNCTSRDGNVNSFELIVIALIIANYHPKNLLEIGTFDGNTTLQMALNAPEGATIQTIDLPKGQAAAQLPITKSDLKFIKDDHKHQRKFIGSPVEKSIIQHFGDSTTYDFSQFTSNGLIDLCFIDGSHSYECVKSDTEKTLKILAPKGIILWHDCDPSWAGVYRHLYELSKTRSLVRISGTSLAMLQQH